MNPRVFLTFPLLLAACESTTTTSSSSSSGESCDSFLNQDGLGSVTLTVENQRAEPIVLPSPCCNPRPPQMEVSFGEQTEAPTFPMSSCACTCERFMPDSNACGCSVEVRDFRWIGPGGSVSFDWAGTYYEQVELSEQCAAAGQAGPCLVERPVPAGELVFTLHLLTNADVPDNPDCPDGVCTTWDHDLGGQEETITASVDYEAAGSQQLAVTVD